MNAKGKGASKRATGEATRIYIFWFQCIVLGGGTSGFRPNFERRGLRAQCTRESRGFGLPARGAHQSRRRNSASRDTRLVDI